MRRFVFGPAEHEGRERYMYVEECREKGIHFYASCKNVRSYEDRYDGHLFGI